MANIKQCPNCRIQTDPSQQRWGTAAKEPPVDVLICVPCGGVILEEDWFAPLAPILDGACINCGDIRRNDRCISCELTEDDDYAVHDELRTLVAPKQSFLNAAREANQMGRRILALKLATAATVLNENENGQVAHALRIWLISAIGKGKDALRDAKQWIESSNSPSSIALASYGHQLENLNQDGLAAEAYQQALEIDANQHSIRTRMAQILQKIGRHGQAIEEIGKVFEAKADDKSVSLALAITEEMCEICETSHRHQEIARLLLRTGSYIERSPHLLGQRARLAAMNGDVKEARQDLKRAMRLKPNLEIYDRVRDLIKPGQQSTWWRW